MKTLAAFVVISTLAAAAYDWYDMRPDRLDRRNAQWLRDGNNRTGRPLDPRAWTTRHPHLLLALFFNGILLALAALSP